MSSPLWSVCVKHFYSHWVLILTRRLKTATKTHNCLVFTLPSYCFSAIYLLSFTHRPNSQISVSVDLCLLAHIVDFPLRSQQTICILGNFHSWLSSSWRHLQIRYVCCCVSSNQRSQTEVFQCFSAAFFLLVWWLWLWVFNLITGKQWHIITTPSWSLPRMF